MELRQLKSFILAAKYLNFTEASREMCVNQSTFSQNIKSLEEELGVVLFYRNSHEVTLTEAGRELHPFALTAVQQAEDAKKRMRDLQQLRHGTLLIGATHSFSSLLQDTLHTFLTAYPAVRLVVHYKTHDELMRMLLDRKVDFVLSHGAADDSPLIESHLLFEARLSLVVRKEHPVAKEQSLPAARLSQFSLALPAVGMQARSVLDSILEAEHLSLNPKIEIDEVMPLLQLVRGGDFATVLSSAAAELDEELTAVPIDTPIGIMHGTTSVLRDSYRKASMIEFVRMLAQANMLRRRFMDWGK